MCGVVIDLVRDHGTDDTNIVGNFLGVGEDRRDFLARLAVLIEGKEGAHAL